MSSPLPDLANPWRLVQSHACFEATASAASLPRLRDAVLAIAGDLHYRMAFGHDIEGRAQITGQVRAEVRLPCRRCLQPVQLALESALCLTMVMTDAEADRLDEERDPVVLEDAPMRLLDLLEDELLLSLPAFPQHTEPACENALTPAQTQTDQVVASEPPHPFAMLAKLKNNLS